MDSAVSRPRSVLTEGLSSAAGSTEQGSVDMAAASWPVMGLATRLVRSSSSNGAAAGKHHQQGRRPSKPSLKGAALNTSGSTKASQNTRPGSRRTSLARVSVSPSSSHRTNGLDEDYGDDSPAHSRTSSSGAFSRKQSVSFSLSSFKQEMVKSKPPKLARRHSRAFRPGEGEATDGKDISHATISKVLRAETKRMKSKATSKTYINDRRTVLVERELLHVHKTMTAKGKTKKESSVLAKTMFNTFSAKQHQDGDQPVPTTTMRMTSHDHVEQNGKWLGKVTPMKWAMTVVIAIIIALQAGVIILGAFHLTHWKLDLIWTHGGGPSTEGRITAWAFLLIYGLVGALIASLLVTYVAPHAGGSGIPEIKACLNGVPQPPAFTFATWASRSIGLLLVTSGGLFAGTEGPFAHLGAIVASAVAEGPTFNGQPLWPAVLTGYRNRCDFISQGAAMGVAAAFGAPVGGILFSLEEASTFWSKSVTWQAFLGALVAAVIAKLAKNNFQELPKAGFIEFPDHDATFKLWEMGIFMAIGLGMGLLGALFCQLVKMCLTRRRRLFRLGSPTVWSRRMRICEVMCVVFISLSLCFWVPTLYGCTDIDIYSGHEYGDDHHRRRLLGGGDSGPPDMTGGLCHGDQYNTIAHLLLEPKEAAIKALFSAEMKYGAVMEISSLLVSWLLIFFCTILTFGCAIPVGLFIPNILAGACLGRAVGQAMLEWGYEIHPGVYALMGAAGGLAGFSRMTMSLAVIFLEITNNMYLLLPLMMVIMTAKTVADRFNPSVYDIVLELNPEIHLLEDNLSEDMYIVLEGLTAHDACTAEVAVLREIETVRQICCTLMQTQFGTYPLIDEGGRLVGTVSRMQLTMLLAQHQAAMTKGAPEELVNLQDLAEMSPEMTLWNTPLTRSFQHFRSLGLQHLCVVGESMVLLGILTRTDFARLCLHGHEGVEEVSTLVHRKHAAISAGNAVMGYPRSDVSSSTVHENARQEEFEAEDGLSVDTDNTQEHVLVMSSAMRHPPPGADQQRPVSPEKPRDREKDKEVLAAALAVARAASRSNIQPSSPSRDPSAHVSPKRAAAAQGTAADPESMCFEV